MHGVYVALKETFDNTNGVFWQWNV